MNPAYVLDDPRPIQARAPYTYYLPCAERLAAIEPRDEVQFLFRSLAPSPKYEVERMWIQVQIASGDTLVGELVSKRTTSLVSRRASESAFEGIT